MLALPPRSHVSSAAAGLGLVALLLLGAGARAAAADEPARLALSISGSGRLPASFAYGLAGAPPLTDADEGQAKRWAREATKRIVAGYRQRGYSYARAWFRVDPPLRVQGPRGRRIRIHVDEGLVQPVFVGADTVRSVVYRFDLYLPGDVFHRPTLNKALAELRHKYDLANVYHRVTSAASLQRTPLGDRVHPRRLHIYLISRESSGWRLKVSLSTSWGILPKVAYSRERLLFSDDRFSAGVEAAVPYRRFLFEQDPTFQWVHSAANLSYRLPSFFRGYLSPVVDGNTAVSRYVRSDASIRSYFRWHAEGLANLLLRLGRLSVKLGGGLDYIRLFDVQQPAAATEPIPDNLAIRRYLTQIETRLVFDQGLRRRDQRNEMALRVRVAATEEGDLLVDSRSWARLVIRFREHDLLLRGRAVFLAGDVRIWDEVTLAGDHLRCYFDNRYWVHEALQAAAEFRFALTYEVKVGVFHDLALFFDRSRPDEPPALANAFGPGLHLLLFDLFTVDLYYGFGFAPVGFGHNLSFKIDTAF